MNVEELKQQQAAIEQQIVDIDQGNKIGDKAALQNEVVAIINKISELEYQAKLEQEKQVIEEEYVALVEETKAQTASLLETLSIGGLSISQLSASEEAYEILRDGLQMFIDEKDANTLKQIKVVKEDAARDIAELRMLNNDLVASIEDLENTATTLRSDLFEKTEELADMEAKRTAQQLIIEEQQAENDRLKSQVTDLQTEAAIGAREAVKVITSEDLKAKADAYKQSIQDSLIPVTNMRWDEDHKPAQSQYKAELAKTGETITFSWLHKTKYREVTQAEADTFRTEYEAAQQASTDSTGVLEMAEQPVEPTVPPIQDEDSTTAGLAAAASTVAGETVTREEYNQLEERISALEERFYL